jgi:adenosylcobinamide-phosphate synthase
MEQSLILILPLLFGYLLDLIIGDPQGLPHPVRLFGSLIAYFDSKLNTGSNQILKGALVSILLCTLVFAFFHYIMNQLLNIHTALYIITASIFVFYGLANRSLITEGRKVFNALEQNGLEAGRKRLSWIVGRDTSNLSPKQIKISVFETMSENLSDGVIAPLFYFLIGGIPGMMVYKMINTLDSMVGYRNERYEQFGKFAARLDDVANFIPARLTALLMCITSMSKKGFMFIFKFGNNHKSPNSGYPEAALAGILDVRFGGPNVYHGVVVNKPFIGEDDREIAHQEINRVALINHKTTFLMVLLIAAVLYFHGS